MNIESRCLMSIGGGINLRPNEFKRISHNRNSPKIREITRIKGKMKTVGKVAKSGSWIRNQHTNVSGSRINKLPTNSWIYSKSTKNGVHYNYKSNTGDYFNLSLLPFINEWQYETNISGSQD